MSSSYYWHDYETWGCDPRVHRPSQFAGVRTDEDFNIVGDPHLWYCQPPEDIWPEPAACEITGIHPLHARQNGLPEPEFIGRILTQMSQANTCNIGYNSIRFDDEVSRHTAFRNFHDPYAREWQAGCTRWDLIDLVRSVYALRPEGIHWPQIGGEVSLRLEHLSAANGIAHNNAHDALSDVIATIELAKLIKKTKPQLFEYFRSHRSKQACEQSLALGSGKMVGHISSMFGKKHRYCSAIQGLMRHPSNRNQILCYDLRYDPREFETLSSADIKRRLYSKADELGADTRFPLKAVHINRSPVLFPAKVFTPQVCEGVGLSLSTLQHHQQQLHKINFTDRLAEVMSAEPAFPKADCEASLYEGFIDRRDRALCEEVVKTPLDEIHTLHLVFDDSRLNELFARYRARYAASKIDHHEQDDWYSWVKERLTHGDKNFTSPSLPSATPALSLADYLLGLSSLSPQSSPLLLSTLLDDVADRCQKYAIDLADYPLFEQLRVRCSVRASN